MSASPTTHNQWTDPLIVTVAPNGAYKQPADHPAVPITPATLATTAKSCLDAGAAMLHMHIRDAQGRHSLDVEGYREAQRVVRQAVGDAMVIQITSEAAGVYQAPAQIAMVEALQPEAVSIGLREIDKPEIGEAGLQRFFADLAQRHTMVQVILYDVPDLRRWQALRASGVVPDAAWFLLFVLGRYSAGQTSARATCCRSWPPTKAQSPGPCAPLVLQKTPASLLPRCLAATRASALKTTCCARTAAWPPTTPRWYARPSKQPPRWAARWQQPLTSGSALAQAERHRRATDHIY